jgi:flagellar hook protein FlgE
MPTFSIFTQPTSALRATGLNYNVIGDNIANSVTPGYKAAETRFSDRITELDAGVFGSFNGTTPVVQQFIDKQGLIQNTNRLLDLAIDGKGFFVTNEDVDGGAEMQLTRAGQFEVAIVDSGTANERAFLTDGNGGFVFGWPADGNGGFSTGTDVGSLEAIQIDASATSLDPTPTSAASLDAVLPADAGVGDDFDTAIALFDNVGETHLMTMTFTKTGLNAWDMDVIVADSDLTAGVFPTQALTFDASGNLTSTSSVTVAPTFTTAGGGSISVVLDISELNEFAANFTVIDQSSDGNSTGNFSSLSIDQDGVISGVFDNGETRGLYKLPLATVVSANKLSLRSNTHYAVSANSGDITLLEADQTAQGRFIPSALESSTTQLEFEFARMIQNQQMHSSNVRAYTVAEEMVRTAVNLKQ